jgi:hypothetical protein
MVPGSQEPRGALEGGDAMKRTVLIGFFGLSAAALLGCPVFSGGNNSSGTCYGTGCETFCYSSNECPTGYSCQNNYCEPGSEDASQDAGDGGEGGTDCSVTGCSSGQVCAVVDGGAVCIPDTD